MTDSPLADIRAYWTKQALTHGQEPAASWSDRPAIDLEIRRMLAFLTDGDRVVDIGCANGYSTLHYALGRDVRIHGVDVVSEMVEQARARLEEAPLAVRQRVTFEEGDIMDLARLDDDAFDVAVVTRVLINLGTWGNQVVGLQEALRCVRPGGLALFSEATVQGWQRLNDFRAEWGLGPLAMPPFNTYLDQEKMVEAVVEAGGVVETVDDFASSYFVGTRVLKPLLSEALEGRVDIARAESHWNRWWSQVPPVGDYGTQKLFVVRKGRGS
jgi:SAM-dependent methyltransferase